MKKIADYDTLDYDYRTYWKNREYENQAEHLVLNKIYKHYTGNWFVDIGGSYGRLADIYSSSYKHPVIIDYSLKTLQKNREYLLSHHPNLTLIAANAYNLPFKANSFDGGVMVRVLHHINEPLKYFKEVHRVMGKDAIYVQEFANKVHIKAVLRAIFKWDLSLFNKDPYQQPDRDNNEGARKGSEVPFLNFHPKWIKESLNNSRLQVRTKYGCSYLRSALLKRTLGTKTMLILERIFQTLLSWSNTSPSIFFETKISKENTLEINRLEDILVCPHCHGNLEITNEKATCKACEKSFSKKENIWDFRV